MPLPGLLVVLPPRGPGADHAPVRRVATPALRRPVGLRGGRRRVVSLAPVGVGRRSGDEQGSAGDGGGGGSPPAAGGGPGHTCCIGRTAPTADRTSVQTDAGALMLRSPVPCPRYRAPLWTSPSRARRRSRRRRGPCRRPS